MNIEKIAQQFIGAVDEGAYTTCFDIVGRIDDDDFQDISDEIAYSGGDYANIFEDCYTSQYERNSRIKQSVIRKIRQFSKFTNKNENHNSIKQLLKEHIRKILLKEGNEQEQIAIDLIDYLGKQLPRMNWKMDRRISGFFQELGMNVNDPQVAKIYQTALRLNR